MGLRSRSIGGGFSGVATAGAVSIIASIQRGTVTLARGGAATATATITAVNPQACILHRLGQTTEDPTTPTRASSPTTFARIDLTNATTVTATTDAAVLSDQVISFEVIEFLPGIIKSVQQGTIALSALSNTATITAVNPAKSMLMFEGEHGSGGFDTRHAKIVLTNATTVTANYLATGETTTVGFSVVEFY